MSRKLIVLLTALLLAFGMTACKQEDREEAAGAAAETKTAIQGVVVEAEESAGEAAEDAGEVMEDAGEAIEDAAEDVEDAAEEAADKDNG
jgi:hypothetical protein